MKTVLITGGSSGIGFELSKHFAKAGYRLLWVAKPEKELESAKTTILEDFPNLEIHTLAKDLCLAEAPNQVKTWSESISPVDVLVNNAGYGTYGFLQNTNLDKELGMIQLNILAVYKLTRLYLGDMITRDSGTIINISSNSSFQPIPKMNTYASTKAFVKHFSRGLNEELKMQNAKVKVMTVCPAAVQDTPFKTAANMDRVKTFSGLAFTTAKEVAKDTWKGFEKGKSFVVSGAKMRFLYLFYAFIPFSVQQFLVRREIEEA